jgi:hypothetical protein
MIAPGSPCTDRGHPAPEYEDACSPPSLGTARNDVGAHGGPGACSWIESDPWADLGNPLAGSLGTPVMTGEGLLVGNTPVALQLSQALPGASPVLIIGLSDLSAPFKGGVLVPFADVTLSGLPPTDVSGALTLAATWPPGLPSRVTIYYQFWIPDPAGVLGFAASNAISGTTP